GIKEGGVRVPPTRTYTDSACGVGRKVQRTKFLLFKMHKILLPLPGLLSTWVKQGPHSCPMFLQHSVHKTMDCSLYDSGGRFWAPCLLRERHLSPNSCTL